MPAQLLFLGVENSATRRARRDRLDERAAARDLAIAQSTSRDTRKLYHVSHRLILQAIQEVRTKNGAAKLAFHVVKWM
jgi:hypothetical protein